MENLRKAGNWPDKDKLTVTNKLSNFFNNHGALIVHKISQL